MKVIEFNIEKGLYHFQIEGLETEIHSHPAMEIVIADSGEFELSTATSTYHNLTSAIIDANVPHNIYANDCLLNTVMIEHNSSLVKEALSNVNIYLNDGIFTRIDRVDEHRMLEKLKRQVLHYNFGTDYDKRVTTIIDYLNNHQLEYEQLIETIEKVVNLSPSRLSHLFKENTGISLKKYLVWCKLKTTINQYLGENEGIFTSLIQSGFYDQPHFSRAFKTMLGVKPSTVYNSRIIQ